MDADTDHRTPAAALWGAASATVALGAGELVAGSVRRWRSPVEAVAESVIDRAPSAVTRFGIETFGTNDKVALVVGIVLVIAAVAPLLGVLTSRGWPAAVVGFGAFGAVGAAASLDAPGAPPSAVVPSVVAAAVGASTLAGVLRPHVEPASPGLTGALVTRRGALVGAGAVVALGAVMVAGGRALRSRFSAVASRAALVLPRPRRPLPPPDPAAAFGVAGLAPLFTPNEDFYRIDTALTVPQVPVEGWRLRVHGMVDDPFEVDFDGLVAMGLVEADITLTCVSNQVGGDLVGNARWLGVPLRALLDRAGVAGGADQVVGRSVDGYTGGFPVEAAYDRQAMVAVGMNGEPLPLAHGFPARLVTPGLYGYVSATKWLTEIELTTFARFDQYWVPRGYAERAPIKTMARIDVPRTGQIVDAGDTVVAGVAWAQTRGIAKVEVSIDGAAYAEAELAAALGEDTWRQWRLPWTATPGSHRIAVRATDGDGRLQTEDRAAPLPDGASGWQSLLVTVRAS